MSVKLCVFCKHCVIDEGYYFSEMTMEDPTVKCEGGYRAIHLVTTAPMTSRAAFVAWNKLAEKCAIYTPDVELS